jgi:hypothetical protein
MRGRKAMVLGLGLGLGTLIFTSSGCGSGLKKPEMGKVRGTVTYKGAPVTTGLVTFFPAEGGTGEAGQPAISELSSDGSFELTTFDTGDGAVLGQHKAVVVAKSKGGEPIPEGKIPSQLPEDLKKYEGPKPLVPEKYMSAEKTPLRYKVRPGDNNFAIELKD